MENNKPEWVSEQIANLDPPTGWQPDATAALARFYARAGEHATWPRWLAWAAAVALSLAGILLLPEGRAIAQQLWQLLSVKRVAFVRVNGWPVGVPSPKVELIGTPIPPIPARDVDEARRRVHYDPRLPRPGVLSGTPRFYTTFSLAEGTVVKVAD